MSRDPSSFQSPVSPEDERRMRRALDSAKSRGGRRMRPGDMENVPDFERVREQAAQMQPAPGANAPPAELSAETQQGLEAMQQAAPAAPQEEPEAEEPSRQLSPEELMRARVEARLQPVDIGQFLMNGVCRQTVRIIDTDTARLEVVFQSCPESLEVFIDARLSEEAALIRHHRKKNGQRVEIDLSQREYLRRQNEWALAAHLKAYQGNDWPAPTKRNGEVDADAMQLRMQNVRQIPSPVFLMVTQNLGWFVDRVGQALTGAALGNG